MGYVEIEGQTIKQAACGFDHSACVTESGELYTWGDGKEGQLGLGDVWQTDLPTKVEIESKAVKVLCGAKYTIFLDD